MRLLIVSFYCRPDLSAGSFRVNSLIEALSAKAPEVASVHVVTTLPNRYRTFSTAAPEHEVAGNVEISRICLPPHSSDMRGQARAFLKFARDARNLVRERDYDVVIATSSRLMTAVLGASIARAKKLPLYLDIRDIFAETMGDILPKAMALPVRMVFSGVERWTIAAANRVNLVSRGFEGYFGPRYPRRTFSWYTNGVDDEFAALAEVEPTATAEPSGDLRPTILYAGNLGEGQALHNILPSLAVRLRDRARFLVIGDGGRREQLVRALAAAGADNVEMCTPVPRAELIERYRAAHVLFLHLGNQPAFERVLPSKLFEYAALGKPVLAGIGGYAADFVRSEITNAALFEPCNADGAVAAFDSLILRPTPRPEFIRKFLRTNIMRQMADDIAALGRESMVRK